MKNTLQKIYNWIGFIFFWLFVISVVIVWGRWFAGLLGFVIEAVK